MKTRTVFFGVAFLALSSGSAMGQNSVFGARGLGFPTHRESARTVALGGGPMMFDQSAFVNPAAAALVFQTTVSASTGATYRNYRTGSVDVSGLQETRFPLASLTGRVAGTPFAYQLGYASFVERTFAVTLDDTVSVLGSQVAVRDSFASDGGIVDVRGTAGWSVRPQLHVGFSLHRLAGSSRLTAAREFDDATLRSYSEQSSIRFAGNGVSAGLIWFPTSEIGLAFAGRLNSDLTATVNDGTARITPMPHMIAVGFTVRAARTLEWAASAQWRSWGRTQRDLGLSGTQSFDTWEIGTGLELRRAGNVGPRLPIRIGIRYAQLPFSPDAEQPRELNLAIGTGLSLAGGMAKIDVAVERLKRDGAGVAERGFYLTVGMTVNPSR